MWGAGASQRASRGGQGVAAHRTTQQQLYHQLHWVQLERCAVRHTCGRLWNTGATTGLAVMFSIITHHCQKYSGKIAQHALPLLCRARGCCHRECVSSHNLANFCASEQHEPHCAPPAQYARSDCWHYRAGSWQRCLPCHNMRQNLSSKHSCPGHSGRCSRTSRSAGNQR